MALYRCGATTERNTRCGYHRNYVSSDGNNNLHEWMYADRTGIVTSGNGAGNDPLVELTNVSSGRYFYNARVDLYYNGTFYSAGTQITGNRLTRGDKHFFVEA